MSFGPPRSTGRVDDKRPEASPLAGLCGVGLFGTREQCTHDDGHDGEHSWVAHPVHQRRLAERTSQAVAASGARDPNTEQIELNPEHHTSRAPIKALDNQRLNMPKPAPTTSAPTKTAAQPSTPSPFALTVEDQRICAANNIDPAAFAQTRAQEIAERQGREREESAARVPAPEIKAPRAVLTEADRRFCERMQIDEATFLTTRQAELDEQARAEAYRRS